MNYLLWYLRPKVLVMQTEAEVTATVAAQVRDFYDAHPYPPPVRNLDEYRQRWADAERRRADFHLFFPDRAYHEKETILVAGCGTAQAAKYALRQPAAQVVGIDVSQTSMEHTEALKQQYRLENLALHQLPMERAGELGRRFDRIVCTGVLHHLPDPDAGLAALRSVLAPDGAMHLMVYATYGRAGIYMLQEYAQRLGLGHTDAEIKELAETLMSLPLDHPLARLLGESPDFRRKDALADALLNPRDRAYTVPQLLDFLERSGLVLGRWVRQAPYLPQCGALAETPHRARLARLPRREQYAAVELFRGTMLRHSLVAYRADQPADTRRIRFDDERWLAYIPLRTTDTVTVRKRLPPGAAAVLINRQHTDPDLVLPIDATERRLLAAVDGKRTVQQILQRVGVACEMARACFERLWHYDQLVFDTSNSHSW